MPRGSVRRVSIRRVTVTAVGRHGGLSANALVSLFLPRRIGHMTIIEALADRNLFGGLPAFKDLSTWRAWLVFLRAAYGLQLGADDCELFKRHTGRSGYHPPPGGWPEVACIVGRQSGKTRIAATVAAFEAATVAQELDGTELFGLLIAQDQRASVRTLFRYARAPFERVPMLQQLLANNTAEAIGLSNGCTIAAYPARPAAVRGLRARVVVLDELAFYRSSDNLPIDAEMLRAVRPCLATTGGKLFVLSSPYAQAGALYDLHRRHFGRDDSPVLVWQASAPEMNPTLSPNYLQRMAQDDPEAYRSEVLGEFRAGVATFLDADAIAASVDSGVRERSLEPGLSYVSFEDPASGSGADAWTKAIAHREGDRVVLDVLRSWLPPFNPSGVIAESAALSKTYGLHVTTGDRYAPGFVLEAFRAHGLKYAPSVQDRSALYLELLPLVNAGRVRLLDLPDLLRELRGLERRRGTAGRDRVDHAPGQHDDRSNAAAGALVLAAGRDDARDAEVRRWALDVSAGAGQFSPSMPMASDGCPRP